MTPYYLVLSHDFKRSYYALFRTQAEAETYEKLWFSSENSDEDFVAKEDYYEAHAIKGITDVAICSDFLSDNNGYIAMTLDVGFEY